MFVARDACKRGRNERSPESAGLGDSIARKNAQKIYAADLHAVTLLRGTKTGGMIGLDLRKGSLRNFGNLLPIV
jgi:hypothetical protein